MKSAWTTGLKQLRDAGAEIVEITWPGFDLDEIWRRHRVLMAVEIAADHQARLAEYPDDYPKHVRELIAEGLSIPAAEYLRCRRHQARLRRSILEWQLSLSDGGYDDDLGLGGGEMGLDAGGTILCPAAPGPAPTHETTGNPRMNSPWSYLGLASLTVPLCLASNGLPLGMQLVSATYTEEDMIQEAVWCENVFRQAQSKPTKPVKGRKKKA